MYVRILIVTFSVMLFLSACSAQPGTGDEMLAMADEMEEALGEEWDKQTVTEVLQFELSTEDGETYILYLCQTTYHSADPSQVTGLDENALSAVFLPENFTLHKEWVIEGHSSAIYQGPERSYLCWTSSPEVTGILEYSTGTISDADAYKIVESVYVVPTPEHT